MRNWSLKLKFGVYAAALATFALLVGALTLIPTVTFQQIKDLDSQITQDAGEFFRDLQNFRGAPVNPRHPLSSKFVPLSLENRYILLTGPEGQVLYESPNLTGKTLPPPTGEIETATIGGLRLRIGSFEQSLYSLRVGADMAPIKELRNDLFSGLLYAIPATALVVFLGGFWLGKYAVSPIADLTAAAQRISVNRLGERLPIPPSKDEINSLTSVLNDAFDRLQASYEAATRFSADASHQLKTPIAILRLGIESLRDNKTLSPTQSQELESLLQQTRRLNALIDDLLLLAQADSGRLSLERKTIDAAPLIQAAIDDIGAIVFDRDVAVEIEIPEKLPILADYRRLRLALQVLSENAAKYTPPHGTIRVTAKRSNDQTSIIFFNTGNPIPPKEQTIIFERFRRAEGVGENISGHGLGLNIAQTLLKAHGGELTLERSDSSGTVFTISLPIDPGQPQTQ